MYVKIDREHKCRYDDSLPFVAVDVLRDDGTRIPVVPFADIGKEMNPEEPAATASYYCSRCKECVGHGATWPEEASMEYIKNVASGVPHPRDRGLEFEADGRRVPYKRVWTPCKHSIKQTKSCMGVCPQCLAEVLAEED